MRKVQFLGLEDSDKDIIVSFAIGKSPGDIVSLILHRQLFYEELMEEEERGVHVSLENENISDNELNMLCDFKLSGNEIEIKSTLRSYKLDVSSIEKEEIDEMLDLLKKQNYDNRFSLVSV